MKDQWGSFTGYVTDLGRIFGKEKEAEAKLKEIEALGKEVREKAQKAGSALFLLTSAGAVNAYGKNSRFGFIYSTLGLTPVEGVETKDAHGQAVSFEFLKEKNPAHLFVLDRDATIGREKQGQSAKALLDNDLVKATDAAKNGKIAYVDGPSWYLVGYGLGNLPKMYGEIKAAL